jgi:hypothetical protein
MTKGSMRSSGARVAAAPCAVTHATRTQQTVAGELGRPAARRRGVGPTRVAVIGAAGGGGAEPPRPAPIQGSQRQGGPGTTTAPRRFIRPSKTISKTAHPGQRALPA